MVANRINVENLPTDLQVLHNNRVNGYLGEVQFFHKVHVILEGSVDHVLVPQGLFREQKHTSKWKQGEEIAPEVCATS